MLACPSFVVVPVLLSISNVITSAEKGQTPCYKGLKAIFSSPLVPSLVPRDEAPVCSSCWVAIDKIPRSPADSPAMFASYKQVLTLAQGSRSHAFTAVRSTNDIGMCSSGGLLKE